MMGSPDDYIVRHDPEAFAIDKGWLRPLGFLRGPSLRSLDIEQRRALLDDNLDHQPFVLTGSDYDPASSQLITVTSVASYNENSGIFDYRLVYWRHLPEANGGQRADSDQHVISIRGIRGPSSDPFGVPEIIPDQIWFNGSCLFNGPANGGADDPHRPEYRRLLTRVLELGKRVNEKLMNNEPVHKLGEWLAGQHPGGNFAAGALGGAPTLRGLTDKGWDPYQRLLDAYFTDLVQAPGEKIAFEFPLLGPLSPLDRLKTMLGMHRNSLEPARALHDMSDEHAGDLETGIGYLCGNSYAWDKEKQQHVFRVRVEPQSVPEDQEACEPFDVMELAFSQPSPTVFQLDSASFMGNGPDKAERPASAYNHIGFFQETGRAFARRAFPALHDITTRNRLLPLINEIHVPPAFAETGGETLWASIFGVSLEKKVENYGDGIGGGQLFLQRGRKPDGTIDEIAVLHGLPFECTTPDSDYDGMQPDIMRFRDALRRGVLIVDHIHFDHSTIEYYASQMDGEGNGWLKGQKILCKEYDAYIMKDRLKTLGVKPDQWPHFIAYDSEDATLSNPDLHKIDDHRFAYRVRDEDGNTRFWVQICKNGTIHSARTDSYLVTGCFNDAYQDTYFLPSDGVGLTREGWDFAEKGQMALVGFPGVSEQNLLKAVGNKDELYIALVDPTSADLDGHAPKFTTVKDELRTVLKSIPEDHALIIFPFSTNDLDIRAALEVLGETGTLRNVTAVGKNAETRFTALNKYGMDPDIDLAQVVIPPDRLPQSAYDASLAGAKNYLARQYAMAERLANRRGGGVTPERLLTANRLYHVMRYIVTEAEQQQVLGNSKPHILYDAFFSGREDAIDVIANRGTQANLPSIPATATRLAPPADIGNHLEGALEARKLAVADSSTDTAAFMLRSLVNNQVVKFETRGSINETQMYHAIMHGQETASCRAVRTSKKAKAFRKDCGRLAVFSTGPIGSIEEFMASLSRFRRGDSLFDYDEVTRNTGYKLDPEKMTFLVMQTPSMGAGAALAQESLIYGTAYDRNVTIHLAGHGGLRTINPGTHRDHYLRSFREARWNVTNAGARQDMFAAGRLTHFRGHPFHEDLVDMLKNPRLKAKLVEAIHIPGWRAYQRTQEACDRTGRPISIRKPDTNIMRRYSAGEDGKPSMRDTDYLSEIFWLIKRRAKYGKQYGWVIDFIRAVCRKARGPERSGPLYLRGSSEMDAETPSLAYNDWLKVSSDKGSRLLHVGPSVADIRASNASPLGPTAGAMVRQASRMSRLKDADYV